MIRSLSILTLLAITSIASADDPTPPAIVGKLGTPIALFDGKTLNGWFWFPRPPKPGTTAPSKPATMEDVWSVRDGLLHSNGKPVGYLRTEKSFPANYVLTVEQRHVHKGNGGLLVGIPDTDKVWPGLELQTQTGDAGDFWNHNNLKMTTDPARVKKTRTVKMGPDSENPVGQWNTIVVTVNHGRLWITVNGRLQNLATDTQDFSGKIGLQSEGAEMEFRKIELTPIEEP